MLWSVLLTISLMESIKCSDSSFWVVCICLLGPQGSIKYSVCCFTNQWYRFKNSYSIVQSFFSTSVCCTNHCVRLIWKSYEPLRKCPWQKWLQTNSIVLMNENVPFPVDLLTEQVCSLRSVAGWLIFPESYISFNALFLHSYILCTFCTQTLYNLSY